MLSIIYAIARNTFLESVRQPIYFIIIALAALAQVFTTWTAAYSMGYSDSAEVSGDDKMLLDISLATVFVGGMLLAAFLATSVISKEIERRTVLTVVSKPVPRPAVVLGKYLGVAAAIMVAVVTMLVFVQLSVRHGVLSTSADDIDQPVVIFGLCAVVLALFAGIWGNFFYGWVFSQTATLLLCPLIIAAWVLVLMISKKWEFQPIGTNFKPQIALASTAILLAQLVMTAVATAASARFGQVMTIVICSGVFVMGLLSPYMLGRRAIQNENLARIQTAAPTLPSRPNLVNNGDQFVITFDQQPRRPIEVGEPFYFGANPSGFGLAADFPAFEGDAADMNARADRTKPPALVVVQSEPKKMTIEHVGADGAVASRLPRAGDYVFLKPTRYNALYLGAWAIVPNMQSFWLTDAVTQNQPVPARHIGLLTIYAACLVGVFLCLAVVLFQRREVG